MAWYNPFTWFRLPVDETWDDNEAAYDANPPTTAKVIFDPVLGELRMSDPGGGVSEARVNELIDEAVGSVLAGVNNEP